MPTIPQLPPAGIVSSSDVIPISQGGSVHAASVGELLLAAQPVITVQSPSLLGRTSLGSGGPEQIDVGIGMELSEGTIVANGSDHATYPSTSSLSLASDLVISNQGNQMLMPTEFLRGLFSAGPNVEISDDGIISAIASGSLSQITVSGDIIGSSPLVSTMGAQDLILVGQSGADHAITYANFLSGITIDEAPSAAPAADSDTVWVAQSSNIMGSQSFGSIWLWISGKLPAYKWPVVEVTSNTNLSAAFHNGRILVCSQPVTLTPLLSSLGSGFQCQTVNVSSGNVTLGTGFLTSTGSFTVGPAQSVMIQCLTYSGGTLVYASMPPASAVVPVVPGQVTGLAASNIASTTVTLIWQPPLTGGTPSVYTVQSRPTGSAIWTVDSSNISGPTYQLSGLQPSTSYDIEVAGSNASGTGIASPILTISTTATVAAPLSAPGQVTGLIALPVSGSTIGLSWSSLIGANAATSYTIQYRKTGSTVWSPSTSSILASNGSVAGLIPATSYDFSVYGVNAGGSGTPSLVVSATTMAIGNSVSQLTWNLAPSGTYVHASGSIGVNAHVSPASAAIQFGLSTSNTTPPTSWTLGLLVNTDLWGAYVPTPPTPGTWYAWVEGTDGSSPTVFATPFAVQ